MPIKLGELLVKENLITPQQLQEALQYQKQHGGKLGFNLVKLGFVKDEEITQLLSRQYGVPSINLAWCRSSCSLRRRSRRRQRSPHRSSFTASCSSRFSFRMSSRTTRPSSMPCPKRRRE